MKIHKHTLDKKVLCKRVPDYTNGSTDWAKVTCRYCLKLKNLPAELNKEQP